MKRKIFSHSMRTFALIITLFGSNHVLAAPKGPVIQAEGLEPVVMIYREKDNVYIGRVTLPAADREFSFAIKDQDTGRLLDDQKIKVHESASGYKITFTYNPATNSVSNDYVLAFQGLDGKVAISSLYFNSRDEQYKKPFGPVTAGTETTFTLEAKTNDLEEAKLVMTRQKITGNQDNIENLDKIFYTMVKSGTSPDGSREYWTATIKFEDINVYTYYFEAIDGKDVVIYGNNSTNIPIPANKITGVGGVGEALRLATEGIKEDEIPRYRQTVYDPSFKTPDWSQDIIYYYIFADRFKNGNHANDPKPGKRKFYGNRDITFHKNWLDKPWIPQDKVPNWDFGNDFFGGDIAGMMQKLDYLKELGINTIYSTPLFKSPSNHKYDTSDYMKIDESFGTNEEYRQFVDEAKKKGIRIIMDASLNHSGADSIYMDRYGKYPGIGAFRNEKIRKDSPYYSWYIFDETATDPNQKYPKWAVPSLAEFNKNSESYRKFAYKDKNSVTQYWMDTGISGWRMDVVPWVPDDFWREWRKTVKAKDPDAFTVSEVWWDSSKYFLGDMFDSGMNYVFRQAVFDYVDGKKARDAVNLFEMLRENYPPKAFAATMNIISSHDAPRAVFHFGYKDDKTPKDEVKTAKDKLLLATFMQMTYPGAPTIYYGDEAGVTGGEDPGCRATYPWKEEGGNPDESLLNEFKKLIKLRNDNAVLRRGSIQAAEVDDNIIAMVREYDGTVALVVTNNLDKAKSVRINVSALHLPTVMTDVWSGEKATIVNGVLELEVPAYYGRVLLAK